MVFILNSLLGVMLKCGWKQVCPITPTAKQRHIGSVWGNLASRAGARLDGLKFKGFGA